MLRIAHTSDWHIGKFLKGEKELTRNSVIIAIDKFIDQCINLKVDIVIIAGDIFDKPSPDSFAINQAVNLLQKLKDNNIDVYAIKGNHDVSKDPEQFDFQTLLSMHLVKVLKFLNDEVVNITKNGESISIYGLGYTDDFNYNLIEQLIDEYGYDNTSTNILMLHQSVDGLDGSDNREWLSSIDRTVSVNTLVGFPFDYFALGHHHNYQQLKKKGKYFIYSGSIEHWEEDNWNKPNEITDKRHWALIEIIDGEISVTKKEIDVLKKLRIYRDYRKQTDYVKIISEIKKDLIELNKILPKGILAYYCKIPFLQSEEKFPFNNIKELVPDILFNCSRFYFIEPESRNFELRNASEGEILNEFLESEFDENVEVYKKLFAKLFVSGEQILSEELKDPEIEEKLASNFQKILQEVFDE
jgi:DNA repair protein SbcD/Mre11